MKMYTLQGGMSGATADSSENCRPNDSIGFRALITVQVVRRRAKVGSALPAF